MHTRCAQLAPSAALLAGEGRHGRTLQIIRACEEADTERLAELMPDGIAKLHVAYGDAIEWANHIRAQVGRRDTAA